MELNSNMYASFNVLNLYGEYNIHDMHAQTDVSHTDFHEAFIEQIIQLTKDHSTHDAVHDHCNLVKLIGRDNDCMHLLSYHFTFDHTILLS